jgi:hypothetical protein
VKSQTLIKTHLLYFLLNQLQLCVNKTFMNMYELHSLHIYKKQGQIAEASEVVAVVVAVAVAVVVVHSV